MEKTTMIIPTSFGDIVVQTNGNAGTVALPPVLDTARHSDAVAALTALVLAHACAGIDVGSAQYVEGFTAALSEIA